MHAFKKFLPFLSIALFLAAVLFPAATKAEIATVRDWIGLFHVGDGGNSKSNTISNSWVYTSNCSQTAPGASAVPQLNRNGISPNPSPCTFTVSPAPAPGTYEFRMYANNEETADALIDKKTVIFGNVSDPIPPSISDRIYHITGNLTINSNITPLDKSGVIFVDSDASGNGGDLSINTNLTNANNKTGLVFVVKGDVRIDRSVTRIDAVIIAQGTIYTATNNLAATPIFTCATSTVDKLNDDITSISPLTINGSLISLDENYPPQFCRTLGAANDTSAAEKINQQPKYLVILRHIYSDTLQKWSEISN